MSHTHSPAQGGQGTACVVCEADRHCLHSYFNACPESPDGRWVLVYVSSDADAHRGELCLVERSTGQRLMIADGIEVEDAHRQAHQQWIEDGRAVVFQNLAGGQPRIESVDTRTLQRHVLLRDRLLGWSRPDASAVPVYGPHWEPGEHTGLEMLDVRSGEAAPAMTARQARAYLKLDDPALSLFFPILSPDRKRVMFKLSSATGAGYRAANASVRRGLVVWDLDSGGPVGHTQRWGHPSWHPDSRTIVNVDNVLIPIDTMRARTIPGLPRFLGSHPSVSPDGRLLVTDAYLSSFGGDKGKWSVVVVDLGDNRWRIMHQNSLVGGGTTSHRRPHPHPVFSGDGQRLYFNVNLGNWTALHVLDLA